MSVAASYPTICYDLFTTMRFLRSVAEANAMQEHTRVTWTLYEESAAINGIYKTLFSKEPPGMAEITSDEVRSGTGRTSCTSGT